MKTLKESLLPPNQADNIIIWQRIMENFESKS